MFDTLGGYTPVKTPRQARRSPIGFGDLYSGADQPVAAGGIGLEERDALLGQLEDKTPQFTSSLFNYINAPTTWALDVLSGRPLGSGTTGERFLKDLGLLPGEKAWGGWGRPVAGAALESVVDPFNLVSFGSGAVSKAARAAKAANIFDDVTRVASRRLIDTGGDLGKFGDNALASFQKNFPGMQLEDLTDADLAARPLVGPRQAARTTTLDELVQAQPAAKQAEVMQDIQHYLSRNGGDYDELAKQNLGGDIGFRLPFSDTSSVFQIPGAGPWMAKGLDRTGQIVRWSGPGRHLTSMFDNRVRGTVDEGDQILAKGLSKADEVGDSLAREKTSEMLMAMPEEAFDPQVSVKLRKVIENVATPAERQFIQSHSGLQEFVDKWGQEARDYITRSRKAGIGASALSDKWGTQYFPRSLDELSFEQRSRGSVKGGKNYSVMTGDQLARGKAYHVPGGTSTLQELSLDANVAGPARTITTDRDAAKYIKRKLDAKAAQMFPTGRLPNGKPAKYSLRSAEKLARMLNQIKPEAIKKGYPIFGSHVTEDMARYFAGRERAIQRSDVLYDILASRAKRNNYLDASGEMPITQAMRNLKLKTYPVIPMAKQVEGAAANLIERLQKRAGFSGVDLDELKNISIDKRLMERLNRIADFYHYPEVQSKFLQFVDNITRMWKASILSWPARFTRDWYSGMFSNLLEVGNPADLRRGYMGAQYVLQGQWDRLDPILGMMSRYSSLAPDQRKRRFLADLAASGLLQGRRITDLGGETAARASGKSLLGEMVPGSDPVTTLGYQVSDLLSGRKPVSSARSAYSELGNLKNWAAQPGKFLEMANPFTMAKAVASDELTNPMLRWSAKLGDTTDSINRLSGYIALLGQGLNPSAAASKIKFAQIDYGSLTRVEREWFRRVIPFWAYTSRISKYVTSKLVEDPGGRLFQFGIRYPERLAQSNDQENGYVPASIKQKYGLSLEPMRSIPGLGGMVDAIAPAKEGVSAWLSDIDFPGIDQLNQIKLATNLDGRVAPGQSSWKTFQSFAGGSLHPLLKTGVEALTGQDLYTQRPKATSETTLQAIGRRTGMVDRYGAADNFLGSIDPAVQLVPFAPRALQLARRAVDSERVPVDSARFAQNAFNMFTGTKIQNVSDDVRRYDALQKINDIIGDHPNVRRYEQSYIPEEALPFTDPEVVQLYALQRQLQREQRLERKPPKSVELANPLLY